MNSKYLADIQSFPIQFKISVDEFNKTDLNIRETKINKAYIVGMGGSALYANWTRQVFPNLNLEVHSGYDLPSRATSEDLYIVASHSGNTEETISSLEALKKYEYKNVVVLTSGGKLVKLADKYGFKKYLLPKGIQPRLSTGYFLGYVFCILAKLNLIEVNLTQAGEAFQLASKQIDQLQITQLASKLVGKTPIFYADQTNWAIAQIAKIKVNENSKVQSYWNYFPELNHNEMVGYTRNTANPFFIIFVSKFMHERNKLRIKMFQNIMAEYKYESEIIDLKGDDFFTETIFAYIFADYLSYFLALEYGIDPEPVEMVEKFKKMLVD